MQNKLLNKIKNLALFSAVFLNSSTLYAQVIGDHNGDGLSDISLTSNTSGGSAWLIRNSDFQFSTQIFSTTADAHVLARFWGNNTKSFPGIVKSTSGGLKWIIKKPDTNNHEFIFGVNGDVIPNQGDIDCDGIADPTIVRLGADNNFTFHIRSSKTGATQTVSWGSQGHLPFIADIDGDSCAEIIQMKNFTWYPIKYNGTHIPPIVWGADGDYIIAPQDINGDKKAEFLTSRIENGKQRLYIKYSNGTSTDTLIDVSPSSVPIVGKFPNGFIAYYDRSTLRLVFVRTNGALDITQLGTAQLTLVKPDGTVLLPSQTGILGQVPAGVTPPTSLTPTLPSVPSLPTLPIFPGLPGSGVSTPVRDPNAPLTCVKPRFPDGAKKGRLWKPVKEGGSHTKKGPTYLTPTQPNEVQLIGKNGKKIAVTLRYRFGPGARSTWDPRMKAKDLKKHAPLVLREVWADGTCYEMPIKVPTKRYD